TDRAVSNRGSERAVMPERLVAFEQKTSDQIRGRKIFVTRDSNERSFQPPRHVFDKTRFAAAGRPFENHRKSCGMSSFEELHLSPDRKIIGLSCDAIILDCAF